VVVYWSSEASHCWHWLPLLPCWAASFT